MFIKHYKLYITGIKYNAEKEEKEKQAAKQKKLTALEEAKKLEAEKGNCIITLQCNDITPNFYLQKSE